MPLLVKREKRKSSGETGFPPRKEKSPCLVRFSVWNQAIRLAVIDFPHRVLKFFTISLLLSWHCRLLQPAPPKENAWSRKPEVTPHKNAVVVSVADPPRPSAAPAPPSENVWTRRKAEHDQREASAAERRGTYRRRRPQRPPASAAERRGTSRRCRPQRPPASAAPAHSKAKEGGRGLMPSWPPSRSGL